MIRLFVNNEELELTKDVDFAITRQFEELTNPTVIINDWSKTVEIPFTTNNNNIFGGLYNIDRTTVSGGLTGLYFDPLKKFNFRLEYNESVIMTGYGKMNTITKRNGVGTYNITLNGSLGKVLQEMQKITFDAEKDDADHYYIAPEDTFGGDYINKNLIHECWNSPTPDTVTYPSLEYIGFAPNNSYNDNFDYASYQLNGVYEAQRLEDTLSSTGSFPSTGVQPSSVVGDGILPKDFGEYRSYLQLPYVKIPKLFDILKSKIEDVTEYTINLDSSWFSSTNILYNNEVMMLKVLEQSDPETSLTSPKADSYCTYTVNINDVQFPLRNNANKVELYNPVSPTDATLTVNALDGGFTRIEFNYEMTYDSAARPLPLNYAHHVRVSKNNGIVVGLFAEKTVGGVLDRVKIKNAIIKDSETTLDLSQYDFAYDFVQQDLYRDGDKLNAVAEIRANTKEIYDYIEDGYSIYINFYYVELSFANPPFQIYPIPVTASWTPYRIGGDDAATLYTNIFEFNKLRNRSNMFFSFNDFWNNDYSLYDCIINYCKIHRILITVDDYSKTVTFIPASKYFDSYSIEDWTDKLDLSRDYSITPCSFDSKYVLFNYKGLGTKLGDEYKDKYGFEYGEKNIVTKYNFNSDTKELFDSPIAESIVYSDNNLSWDDLLNGCIRYVIPNDIIVYTQDKDKKYVSNFGALFINRGISLFDNNSNFRFREALISDDSDFMIINNTYMYAQLNDYVVSPSYIHLDIINGNTMCVMNKPSVNYTYLSYPNTTSGLYDLYWKKYINERYSIGNKLLTCYVMLTPYDFMNFTFNKFVKIENQLYFVNKIYDYSVTDSVPTKVDLITVSDLKAYRNL